MIKLTYTIEEAIDTFLEKETIDLTSPKLIKNGKQLNVPFVLKSSDGKQINSVVAGFEKQEGEFYYHKKKKKFFIQLNQNTISKINEKLSPNKKLKLDKKVNEYWAPIIKKVELQIQDYDKDHDLISFNMDDLNSDDVISHTTMLNLKKQEIVE